MAHSTLGPSQAERWIACPGSVALCEKAPAAAPSYAAAEGTIAHEVAEKFVTGKLDYLSLLELVGTHVLQDGLEVTLTEDMVDGAVGWGELIAADRQQLTATSGSSPVEGQAELRVQARNVAERVWGTADYVLFKRGKKLTVYDYKFGSGVIVDPRENFQLSLYLLGAMDTFGCWAFDELETVIYQPRGRHAEGPMRRWTVSKEWLEQFRETAKNAAAETLLPTAKLAAGDHCRWCPAKPFCPEIHRAAQEAAMVSFDAAPSQTERQDVRLLSIAQLSKMLDWEGAIKALFDSAKDVIREKLTAGEDVPGWKLVEGRSNRQWLEDDKVVAELAPILGMNALYERKLLSPSKMEKLAGKAHPINHLTYKPAGEKAIARDTDPRPAARLEARDAFTPVEDKPHTLWPT